ncbi:MAG: sensor histidine kinase [Acidobacteriota bacterium]
MKYHGIWSSAGVFYLTTALLLTAVVLRSILVYGTSPVLPQALFALIAWSVLFITEREISRRLTNYFTFYLFFQTALTFFLLSLPGSPDSYAVLFFTLSMQAVPRQTLPVAMMWLCLFVALTAVAIARAYGPVQGVVYGLIYGAGIALFASYAHAAERARSGRTHNEKLARRIEEANRQLQQYSQQVERLAATRERQHLARDLHDSVTQTIFSMTLTTQSALLLLARDPSRAGAQLDRLNQLAQSALAEMRVLVSRLDRDAVAERGLAAALRELSSRPEMESLDMSLEVQGRQPVRGAEEQGLFRIAQEALNNVAKHARTDRAWVRLCLDEPPWMEIEDCGCGFDVESGQERGGVGLKSMRERAAEIGWKVEVVSHPGSGTRIRVEKRSA